MFDIRKNLSIALFRIEKSFWYLLRTWRNDDDDDEDDCLSEIDESSRASRSKRSVSLENSRIDFRKNWFEITDENSLKKKL